MTSEIKRIISIEEFANVGPENTVYPQTYKIKSCILCSEGATKTVLYNSSQPMLKLDIQ